MARRYSSQTPEGREDEIIAMAYDLAEQQIRDGTVSATVLAQVLKLGSSKDRLEREIMEEQRKLVSAKTESLESARRIEALYEDAITAFRSYQGTPYDENLQ